jgi:hypothetical protein
MAGAMDLFQGGWNFLTSRVDLLLLLSVPNILIAISEFVISDSFLQFIISLCAIVVYVVTLGMLLYSVTHRDRHVPLQESFDWIKANAGSYIWISILTVLVVWGGFLLFIIPGVILGVYISLSQYAFANEGVKGIAALQRSFALVRGHWWAVAWRIFVMALIMVLLVFVIFFVVGLTTSGLPDDVSLLLTELGSILVGAAASVIFFHAYSHIYSHLAGGSASPAPAESTGKGLLVTFSVLGLLFPVLIGILVVIGYNLDSDTSVSTQDVLQVQAQTSLAGMNAVGYQGENGSYRGVCADIQPIVTAADSVRCNDSADAWALSARIGTDMWCVDSTGYNKRIEKPLDARTACLDLPVTE